MSELKRDYWSEALFCISGKVKLDRREIAAIVECHRENVGDREIYLDIHLKSGSIFTVIEWNEDTIANLYLTESPVEGVKIVPYKETIIRTGSAPQDEFKEILSSGKECVCTPRHKIGSGIDVRDELPLKNICGKCEGVY